jgi:aspartate-semialdehyde dehydrogenase
MVNETRKIFNEPDLEITATCVRVPVYTGHSEAVNVEFEKNISPGEAKEILSNTPGVTVIDEPGNSKYPVPIDCVGKDDVFVGRIRQDPTVESGLNLWIVSDNLRKGAATNTIQIAENLISAD